MKIKRRLQGFKTKIVLTILVVGLLAVLLGLSVTYWVGRSRLEQTIGGQFRELARETSQKLTFLLEHNVEESRLIALSTDIRAAVEQANRAYPAARDGDAFLPDLDAIGALQERWARAHGVDEFVQRYLDNPASRYLQSFLRDPAERAEKLSVVLADRRGVLVGADAKPGHIYFGDETWWNAAFDRGRGRVYISDIEMAQEGTDEFEKVYTLTIAVPVMDAADEHAIGALRMQMHIKRFFEAVTNVRIAKTDHTMLASSDGTLLFCPVFLIRNHTLKPELMQTVLRPDPGWSVTSADVHYGGRPSLNGFAPVTLALPVHPLSFGGKGWFIFTSQDPKETYEPIDTLLVWITFSGVLGAGLLSFLGFWATSEIVRPMQELQRGAKLIGFGNLDHRLRIQTGDEIQELADEFNDMAIKLKASYSNLEHKVAERTKELAVINKINRIISSSLDRAQMFDRLAQEVQSLIEYDRISIALLDNTNDQIRLRLVKDRDAPLITRELPARPKTDTAVGWVVGHVRPFVRADILETQQFVEDRILLSEGLRSYIILPIVSKMKAIGTLNLASGRPVAFSERNLEILVPIAEQLAIAIENATLFEQTRKLDQLKSEFVSKVSHELRTPLTSIKGFTEILLSYDDVEIKTQKEFLGIIKEECDRLTRLINDILDLSKIEAGKIEWRIAAVRVQDVIRQSVKSLSSIAQEKQLAVDLQVPDDLPAVRADRDQLVQVMHNLISNAVKFTTEGRIAINARLEHPYVRVAVADTGCGIRSSDIERLFDKFLQLGGRREGQPFGTGLGLAISKEIVTYLGGRIWCESEIGRGSTFIFTLPIWMSDVRLPEPVPGAVPSGEDRVPG